MAIKESGEMYLETILILSETHEHVRSIDIANAMNFSKPSVSRAVGILRDNGHIDVDNDGYITLTASGQEIADKIYARHTNISRFLEDLGVDKAVAAEDACRIEHVISDESFEAIKKHMKEYFAD